MARPHLLRITSLAASVIALQAWWWDDAAYLHWEHEAVGCEEEQGEGKKFYSFRRHYDWQIWYVFVFAMFFFSLLLNAPPSYRHGQDAEMMPKSIERRCGLLCARPKRSILPTLTSFTSICTLQKSERPLEAV